MWPFRSRQVSFREARQALNAFQLRQHDYIYRPNIRLLPDDPFPPVYAAAENLLRLMLHREPTPEEVRALYEVPELGDSGTKQELR
jgi:hypothetical protein